MRYHPLGRSGLQVSVLTFGTMSLGGEGMFGDRALLDQYPAE